MARQSSLLITGGSGRLGRELVAAAARMYPELGVLAPSHQELDILDERQCQSFVHQADPSTIIHAAALANSVRCEEDRDLAYAVNVLGTWNMLRASRNRRFVLISTDYVFAGDRAPYSEISTPAPVNYYGLTKLLAETMVLAITGTLVLRAPFRHGPPWPYASAFSDQFTSGIMVRERAPQILHAAGLPCYGVLHIGGPRRSILDLARSVSPDVAAIALAECTAVNLPRDVSLLDARWKKLLERFPLCDSAAVQSP